MNNKNLRVKNKLVQTKLGPAYLTQVMPNKYLLVFQLSARVDGFNLKHRHIVNKKRLEGILIKTSEL